MNFDLWVSAHPELVLSVLGAFVKRSVVVKPADVVDTVEALDPLGDSLQLRGVRHV